MKKRFILTFLGFLLIINSCRSSDTENVVNDNLGGISLNLADNDFTDTGLSAPQASLKGGPVERINHQELTSGPFSITAELTPNTSSIKTQASVASGSMAVNKALSLRGAVRYRIVAYNQDGTYIDQAVGDASKTNQVFFGDKLSKGQQYTFVIYSLGSITVDPPAAPTVNLTANPTLPLTFTNYTTADSDFMYVVERNVTILGTPGDNTAPTPLTTSLKHLFTKVNILVDNSDAVGTPGQPGYQKGSYLSENVVSGMITAGLNTSATVNLNNGSVSGGPVNTSFAVNNLNTTAQTYIVNTSGSSSATLSITISPNTIKVGRDINPNTVTINFNNSGTGLQPGNSYTLKLRFNSDRYVNSANETRSALDADAQYAVIGGYRWDRYNLGVANRNPSTNNPDSNPSVIGLHGSYYQRGNSYSAADASTTSYAISGWSPSGNTDTNWTDETKTTSDPCQTGYRVPTVINYRNLVNATKASDIGSLNVSPANYSAAKVLTSKKESSVKLSFPFAGLREASDGRLRNRGTDAYYWTTSMIPSEPSFKYVDAEFYANANNIDMTAWKSNSNAFGMSIRCIQE